MYTSLTLKKEHLEQMIRHVEAQVPMEACGLLAGRNERVESVLRVASAAPSPVRFRMDPAEQLRAFEWIDEHGLDLVGIFHSHPAGPAAVSPTDIAQAAYPVVYIILSRTGETWIARGFWIEAGQAIEVTLMVE